MMEATRLKHRATDPAKPGMVFWGYKRGEECWLTAAKFNRQKINAVKWRKKTSGNRKARYEANPEPIKARAREWARINSSRHRAKCAAYDSAHKVEKSAYNYRYKKQRLASDPRFRLAEALRVRVRIALKGQKFGRKTFDLVGCTKEEFVAHIESKFSSGMTWQNYGLWHLDHVIPCAAFDLTDPGEQKKCFHFSNCQPLWAADNIRKSDTVPV